MCWRASRKKEKLRWRTAAAVRRASPSSNAKVSSGWPQSSFTTQTKKPGLRQGAQGWPAARFFFPLFQFLPPRWRPGARGLGWSGARANAWRPAGRVGPARGAGAGVRRARRAGGGGGGGGRGAAGATCGPADDSGSGRSTPPAARTAATGSSRNSCSRTPASLRPASSSSTLGMQLPSPLRAPPSSNPPAACNTRPGAIASGPPTAHGGAQERPL